MYTYRHKLVVVYIEGFSQKKLKSSKGTEMARLLILRKLTFTVQIGSYECKRNRRVIALVKKWGRLSKISTGESSMITGIIKNAKFSRELAQMLNVIKVTLVTLARTDCCCCC